MRGSDRMLSSVVMRNDDATSLQQDNPINQRGGTALDVDSLDR